MSAAPDEFVELIVNPFQGQDIVTVLASPDLLTAFGPAFTPHVAEGFVTEMVADTSFREERTGMEGFLEAWRDWAAPFDRLRIEVTEVRELGDRGHAHAALVDAHHEEHVPHTERRLHHARLGGERELVDRPGELAFAVAAS